jgi:protein required for attachment to host cells
MKKTITWILIANGAQARVLENTGPGKGLKQVDGLDWSIDPLQAQEIVTDRPGSRGGGGSFNRGGMESRTDPVEHREAQFLKTVMASLERKQQEGAFDRIVIAAAPIALGEIRKFVSTGFQKVVFAELNKDLTNLPTAQLDQHLEGVIAT